MSTTSKEFFFGASSVQPMNGLDVKVKAYPINRNYDAIYTVKIPNPLNFIGQALTDDITKVYFVLPSSLSPSSLGVLCYSLPQNFS